jgi:hypothetical protein
MDLFLGGVLDNRSGRVSRNNGDGCNWQSRRPGQIFDAVILPAKCVPRPKQDGHYLARVPRRLSGLARIFLRPLWPSRTGSMTAWWPVCQFCYMPEAKGPQVSVVPGSETRMIIECSWTQ